jgi:hypothetical protein
LVGKPEGRRPLGRPRRRWEDNIKMDLREIWWRGMDWIDLAQDMEQWRAVVITVVKLVCYALYWSHVLLTSALIGGESSATCSDRFAPMERAPGTHSIGGWVGPRTGLDDVKENSWHYRESNSDPSVVQPLDGAIPVPNFSFVTLKCVEFQQTFLNLPFICASEIWSWQGTHLYQGTGKRVSFYSTVTQWRWTALNTSNGKHFRWRYPFCFCLQFLLSFIHQDANAPLCSLISNAIVWSGDL